MKILKEAPECYIQQCKYCGAVLQYSECDIHPADVGFKFQNAYGDTSFCVSRDDTFVCPSCFSINEAKRRWMIEL